MHQGRLGNDSVQVENHRIKLGLKCHIVYLYFVMSIKVSKFIEAFKSLLLKFFL